MKAADIMTKSVICVRPSTPVSEIAALLLKNGISAVPVLADDDRILGIVSEDDLLRRRAGRRGYSWWLGLLAGGPPQPEEVEKARDLRAEDVMVRRVVTTREEAPLDVVASLLRRYRIKRIPVVRRKKIVGIVSRADLLNAFLDGKKPAQRAALPTRA
jgi:CBS domain-containing protein